MLFTAIYSARDPVAPLKWFPIPYTSSPVLKSPTPFDSDMTPEKSPPALTGNSSGSISFM